MDNDDRATVCGTLCNILLIAGLVGFTALCLSAFLDYQESEWGTRDELTETNKDQE